MNRTNMLIAAALAVVALILGACTKLPGAARLEHGQPHSSGPAFAGLLAPEATPSHRYIYNIHGMGRTADDYNDNMRIWLWQAGYQHVAQSDWAAVRLPEPVRVRGEGLACKDVDRPPCLYETFGKVRSDHFREVGGDREVHVYTYFWHDDLWAAQQPYVQDDMRVATFRMGWATKGLKNQVMDEGFSDAVAYLGGLGDVVREGVRGSVCEMLRDASGVHFDAEARARGLPVTGGAAGTECLIDLGRRPGPSGDVEFGFISHSLGSRMLLDALAPYRSSDAQLVAATRRDEAKKGPGRAPLIEKDVAASTAVAAVSANRALSRLEDKTRSIFMAANQVPLLGLGRIEVRPDGAPLTECVARSFLDFECAGGREPRAMPLDVVAFWDPGDLLGFKANGATAGVEKLPRGPNARDVRFHVVTHRNTAQLAFLGSLPHLAHDQEMHRRSAVKLILCGADKDARGNLTARPCLKP